MPSDLKPRTPPSNRMICDWENFSKIPPSNAATLPSKTGRGNGLTNSPSSPTTWKKESALSSAEKTCAPLPHAKSPWAKPSAEKRRLFFCTIRSSAPNRGKNFPKESTPQASGASGNSAFPPKSFWEKSAFKPDCFPRSGYFLLTNPFCWQKSIYFPKFEIYSGIYGGRPVS